MPDHQPTHAITVTGLHHALATPTTTACGEPTAGLQPTTGDWLVEHPWDLCRNCKTATDNT